MHLAVATTTLEEDHMNVARFGAVMTCAALAGAAAALLAAPAAVAQKAARFKGS